MVKLNRLSAGWLAVVCIALPVLSFAQTTCRLPPAWTVNGVAPMEGTRGHVTVLALLKAS
ncbi:hypothetical protein DPMN_170251 [Dreissena polymorpha]|uniref:Selenoprotein P N-terminal domain-containing protein n=2 Tax=Dreissena polymorpha TaxID=45954 RepID=A0A9D4DYW7_DREPO|nr:hypothetical protein DPMN_170251 [Dreissena polymorpha]